MSVRIYLGKDSTNFINWYFEDGKSLNYSFELKEYVKNQNTNESTLYAGYESITPITDKWLKLRGIPTSKELYDEYFK